MILIKFFFTFYLCIYLNVNSWPSFETQTQFLAAATIIAQSYLLNPHILRWETLDFCKMNPELLH